uniref:ZP domain-containing protein n=1 Tax=Parastrongyloides trichosuri TaxID=131310 RepID=A0A0N4ZUN5_PARTI
MKFKVIISIILIHFFKSIFCDYTKLINSDTHVIIEPLKYYLPKNISASNVNCSFTIHKESCRNPPMTNEDTITWHTTVCLKWKCNAPKLAIKINKCWTGSKNNPIYIIGNNGCTVEGSMIKSPYYNQQTLNEAQSYGRLSVRVYGQNSIKVGCSISFCNICDNACISKNQPICDDYQSEKELESKRPWGKLNFVMNYCDPLTDEHYLALITTSSSIKNTLSYIYFFFILGIFYKNNF